MAIDLNRVKRNSRKAAAKATKTPSSPKTARRPWGIAAAAPAAFTGEFLLTPDASFFPVDLDSASTKEWMQILIRHHWTKKMQEWQRNSYWISRLTHRESWWARLKLYPQLRLPVPSWLMQSKRD